MLQPHSVGGQSDSIGLVVTEFWKVSDRPWGVVIKCRGHDKDQSVRNAVTVFQHIAIERGGAFTIFADLLEMTGYESESRQAWQSVFERYAHRVDALLL